MQERIVVLSFGSNLGDRVKNLQKAIELLQGELTHSSWQQSSMYETEPWGFSSEDIFINNCVAFNSPVLARDLLKKTQEIEARLGREVKTGVEGYQSRVIDIDILYVGDEVINSKRLTIPHPLLYERAFVLVPLNEILPNYIDPVKKVTISSLMKACDEVKAVKLYEF